MSWQIKYFIQGAISICTQQVAASFFSHIIIITIIISVLRTQADGAATVVLQPGSGAESLLNHIEIKITSFYVYVSGLALKIVLWPYVTNMIN